MCNDIFMRVLMICVIMLLLTATIVFGIEGYQSLTNKQPNNTCHIQVGY